MTKRNLQELINFNQEFISKKSISGEVDEGAIQLLCDFLKALGFDNDVIEFTGDGSYNVLNLFSLRKADNVKKEKPTRNLCFAGHTDVVPAGDESLWSVPPFAPAIVDGMMIGRGACDMKSAISAWCLALKEIIFDDKTPLNIDLSLLITGDEEADSTNGTIKLLKYITDKGHKLDDCIVGEPTNPTKLGEMIKVGRRGSINYQLTINGKQGHVAYPEKALNPCAIIVKILDALNEYEFDKGNEYFLATNLEISSIDVGNKTTNLIPQTAKAQFNIRFNDEYNCKTITTKVEEVIQAKMKEIATEISLSNDIIANYKLTYNQGFNSFLCEPSELAYTAREVIKQVTNLTPEFSTTGGTSDARFIKDYARVIEFGLINATAHQIDESVSLEELYQLKEIYKGIILKYND